MKIPTTRMKFKFAVYKNWVSSPRPPSDNGTPGKFELKSFRSSYLISHKRVDLDRNYHKTLNLAGQKEYCYFRNLTFL